MSKRLASIGVWRAVLAVSIAAAVYRLALLIRGEFVNPTLTAVPHLTLSLGVAILAIARLRNPA